MAVLVSDWVKQHHAGSFPLGTLIINLAGCFLIGIAQTFFLELISARRELQLLLVVGLLGGFTTFSTFSVETVRLVKAGQFIAALGYQGLSLGGGIAGVLLGIIVAHVLHRMVLGRPRRP
jgi:CrcB protein